MRARLIIASVLLLGFSGLAALGEAQSRGPKTSSPLLSIGRSGGVLHSPGITAIFWGSNWSNPGFAGDIVSGLETLLEGYSGSAYAGVATEYYDSRGSVTAFAPYVGRVMDSAVPPAPGGLSASVAVAEVCRVTNNRPIPDDIYIVYTTTDKGTQNESGCKFHAWGACGSGRNAVPVQVVGVPYASGEAGTGCDRVQDFETGHSLALAKWPT